MDWGEWMRLGMTGGVALVVGLALMKWDDDDDAALLWMLSRIVVTLGILAIVVGAVGFIWTVDSSEFWGVDEIMMESTNG